ncbi:MAG: S1 domain-containing protein [Acidimicrobiales bacterium]
MAQVHLGIVIKYDTARGIGAVRDDAGEEYAFHCTAITDGSREVGEATAVAFVLGARHGGAMEAVSLTKLTGDPLVVRVGAPGA